MKKEQVKEDKLNFWIPITFEKAVDEKTGKEVMKFQGVASDDSKDVDEEILEPSGFEYNDFLDYGFVNYHHGAKNTPKAIVGEPTGAQIIDNKFIVKGILYNDSKLANDIYETAEMLEKAGSKRRLGFSIEGTPLQRDTINPKRIRKARISGLAITPSPKNKNTIFSLMKGEYDDLFVDYKYEIEKSNDPNGGTVEYLFDIYDKVNGVRVIMNKDLQISIEKTLTTDSESGRALKKESLEKKPKNMFEFDKAILTVVEGHKRGLISDSELKRIKKVIKKTEIVC